MASALRGRKWSVEDLAVDERAAILARVGVEAPRLGLAVLNMGEQFTEALLS